VPAIRPEVLAKLASEGLSECHRTVNGC
jgi:hypothetical protein